MSANVDLDNINQLMLHNVSTAIPHAKNASMLTLAHHVTHLKSFKREAAKPVAIKVTTTMPVSVPTAQLDANNVPQELLAMSAVMPSY